MKSVVWNIGNFFPPLSTQAVTSQAVYLSNLPPMYDILNGLTSTSLCHFVTFAEFFLQRPEDVPNKNLFCTLCSHCFWAVTTQGNAQIEWKAAALSAAFKFNLEIHRHYSLLSDFT